MNQIVSLINKNHPKYSLGDIKYPVFVDFSIAENWTMADGDPPEFFLDWGECLSLGLQLLRLYMENKGGNKKSKRARRNN